MKTFSSLKKFFSLDDAARYFSLTLNEDVTVKDILESALEENITLSIKFENSVSLKTNKLRPVTQQELERYKYIAMDQTKISPDLKILTEDADRLVYLDGIFDIPVLNNCNVDNEIIPMKLQKILNPDKRKDSPSNFIVNRESEYYAIVTEYLPKNEDGMSYVNQRPIFSTNQRPILSTFSVG